MGSGATFAKLRVQRWVPTLLALTIAFTGAHTLAQTPLRNSASRDVSNKESVLSQAGHSYYNLQDEGLASFQCSLTPNWQALLAEQLKASPAAAGNAVKLLNQLRFVVTVSPGKSSITHNELSGQSDQLQAALKQIYGGMEQMTSGFFDTWNLFVFRAPFPEVNSDYRLEDVDSKYRLTYKEGTANVVNVIDKNFAITSLQVSTPEFDSSIRPNFSKASKDRWLLSRYTAVYDSGKKEETTALDVTVDYSAINGFNLPSHLDLRGSYGGSPFAVDLAFSNCTTTKK